MSRFMRAIRPGLSWLSLACLYLAGLGVVLMTVIIGWQVFGRYVLNDSPSWSEPLSLQLMSWFILLGAAVGVRESVHLGLDIVRYNMRPAVQRLMDLISLALICVFGCAMSFYGTQLAIGTWTARIPVLGWPGGIDFIPLIVGGALIAIFALERFIDTFIGQVVTVSDEVAQAEVV
jgi:TRAP-type C4-dicarboxylate transport system permease small subunit